MSFPFPLCHLKGALRKKGKSMVALESAGVSAWAREKYETKRVGWAPPTERPPVMKMVGGARPTAADRPARGRHEIANAT
jgi:hypothetical protein